MLEVRHLKRVYKVKNSNPVYALHDVSLKFPETGLVFILGKSGSGKSTLLNVMGGLDKADDGEIIINGKSSKDFTGSEMDSYRNTYLGFIFQEYNILSDYTVKENIALALQLQHKKATDEEIDKILAEVDLSGYGKRKPNELSGGQKQRVAIARALVKEPKIIFGDEPTGALDSNTGKQVFETLKKLSKDKLVVVVSHDRDFAEHFGDRVIELRDGRVISDISKSSVKAESPSEGLSIMGENVIRLDKSRQLTAEDLPILNKMIANSKNDIFITADQHVNDALCEAARIDKSGNRQEFFKTDENSINPGEEEFSVIKSKYSLGHAFKMGAKSLRVKPFRLVMTIFLSVVSFTMFGVSATMGLFNSKDALLSTARNKGLTNAIINKNEPYRDGMVSDDRGFKEEDLTLIKEKTGLNPYKVQENHYIPFAVNNNNTRDYYHMTYIRNTIQVDDSFLKDSGFKILAGNLPSNPYEFCISKYAYNSFEDFGYGYSDQSDFIPKEEMSMDKVIGKVFTDNNSRKQFTLTGIIDTELDSKFESYRNLKTDINYSDPNYSELSQLSDSSIHSLGFVGKEEDDFLSVNSNYLTLITDEELIFSVSDIDSKISSDVIFFDSNKNALSSNEMILSIRDLSSLPVNDDSRESYDFTFKDAKKSFDGLEDYTASLTNNLQDDFSEFKIAAEYKTIHKYYRDFFDTQREEVIKINEGKGDYSTYPLNCISKNADGSYDFDKTSEADKYNIFKRYCETKIGNEGKSYLNDVSTKYYSFYNQSLLEYADDFVKKNLFGYDLNFLSGAFKFYSNYICGTFINENVDSFFKDYGETEEVKTLLSKMNPEDSLKERQYNVFSMILSDACYDVLNKYNYGKFRPVAEFKSKVISGLKSFLNGLNLSSEKEIQFLIDGDKPVITEKIVGVELSFDSHVSLSEEDCKIANATLSKIYGSSYPTRACIFFKDDFDNFEKFLSYYDSLAKEYDKYDYDKIPDGCYRFSFNTSSLYTTESLSSMLLMLTKIFVFIGIAFAVFSMLLFYNFISISINNKKREIGILRAVGAKRSDVFKIFYSESIIIALINFLLSLILVFIISFLTNSMMAKDNNLTFDIMNPNILVVMLILGIALVSSFLAALLPVIKIANKKPIDAIQNR